MSSTEQQIVDTLRALERQLLQLGDRASTGLLLDALDSLGARLQYNLRNGKYMRPRVLFDLMWVKWDPQFCECISDVAMVLECEWGLRLNQILHDFRKLVLVRAGHRIMIFQARTKQEGAAHVQTMWQCVQQHEGRQSGDRYLFACWVRRTGFEFEGPLMVP